MFLAFNIILAFSLSFKGLLMCWSHWIALLLCMEGMMSLFIMATVVMLNIHFTSASMMPIILLAFTASESTLGLSLLVTVSNIYGIDLVQNLNFLPC